MEWRSGCLNICRVILQAVLDCWKPEGGGRGEYLVPSPETHLEGPDIVLHTGTGQEWVGYIILSGPGDPVHYPIWRAGMVEGVNLTK